MVSLEDKSIALGHPSYIWRQGQERRLGLALSHVNVEGKRLLDVGCGIGAYLEQFQRFTPHVYGVEVDMERLTRAREKAQAVLQAVAEQLPFRTGSFDVVFLHEVLEHVQDDAQSLREACRVTRKGGRLVIYVPNRLYPMETHGFFLGKRYIFRLAPFINYLPNPIRRRLVPHARCYLARDLRRIMTGLPLRRVHWSYVYPGFDSIASRRPWLGSLLRAVTYAAERTPLMAFGISHFLVVEKTD
ncbi:MAG: methyltransferase domain-containing protein [Dehalococcoidia bacterium]|nr:methyltransferase domain-containing protein [Dehalococcoidia bacterium]